MFNHMHLPRVGLAFAVAAALAACSDASLLPPASVEVAEDTITLWAVHGTPIGLPSAFDVLLNTPVRTDRSGDFDILFDFIADSVTGDTVPAFLPRGAVGLSADGGLQRVVALFDTMRVAPSTGYSAQAPVYLDLDVLILARSRTQTCNFGLTSGLYSKLQPMLIDRVTRSVLVRVAWDPNCGYRGIQTGTIPPF